MLSILLTGTETHSKLMTLSEKIASWHGNQLSQGVSDYTIRGESLFLCPKSIMAGVLGSIRACCILDAVYQPSTSATQSLVTFGGSLKTTVKELAMSLHSYNQKPLNKSVSEIQNQLIEISNASDLTERNANFMLTLAKFLQSLGKPIEQLTIAEYVQVIEHCTAAFNAGLEPSIEKVTVSPTKVMSLQKQYEIIGHALTIFCLNPNETNCAGLKSDTVELIRMLEDLSTTPPKTSRFNVLNSTKKLVAKRIPFEQAIKYQDCIIKFAGMEASL